MVKKYSILILCSIFCNLFCNALQIDLSSDKWFVRDETEGELNLEVQKIPTGIYTDLMNNKIIDDIFYGFNDNATKWVSRRNWTYYTNFTILKVDFQMENLNLVLEGVDTISEVFINDILIGTTENMFVKYIFDIKSVAKVGENKLEIKFQSPIEMAEKIAKQQPYRIPWDCVPDEYHGECHVNMLRKMQASFSWDWGPAFPSVGIWKRIYLEAYNSATIRYVTTDVQENEDIWTLFIDVYFSNNTNKRVQGELSFSIDLITEEISKRIDVDQNMNEFNEIVVSTTLEIPKLKVKLWWPNGFGNQTLYTLQTKYASPNGRESYIIIQDVGFRTVELVQDKMPNGLSFYFKINGVPIFMKGSNLIPISILPENDKNEEYITKLMLAAKEANMNMLRVWGGGLYESDTFYSLADKYGILIWQDFMFACALYPASPDFLNNVLEEVRHQVKRLYHHASIVLFSGNNENEGVLANNWYNTSSNFENYKKDYIKLYIDTIEKEFNRLTKNRGIFVSSSPTNGLETIEEGYIAKNPGNTLYGDVHFYNYLVDGLDWKIYPTPRFASEYGYQSFPSISTLLTATDKSNLFRNSTFIKFRQHHPLGNEEMTILIDYELNLPVDNKTVDDFEIFVYYSQIIQAMAVKVQTEHYRIHKSILNEKGEGLTMGALYWQLNDVWVAPTWSSIDFKGRWKMLHYCAKNFFAPVLLSGQIDIFGNANIYVISDLLESFDATVKVQVYDFNSFNPVYEKKLPLKIEYGKSKLIYTIDSKSLNSLNCNSTKGNTNNCFIYLSFENSSSPGNYIFLHKIKEYVIESPNIQIKSIKENGIAGDCKEFSFTITVKSDKIALFVWLELNNDIDGTFSENGFLQLTELKEIGLKTFQNVTIDNIKKSLTIKNLVNKLK